MYNKGILISNSYTHMSLHNMTYCKACDYHPRSFRKKNLHTKEKVVCTSEKRVLYNKIGDFETKFTRIEDTTRKMT